MKPSLRNAAIGLVLSLVLFSARVAGAQAVTAGDFVFAYDDGFQSITTAGVFTPVRFNHNGQISGWVHATSPATSPAAAAFTAMNSGLYLVHYDLEATVNALVAVADTFSARLVLVSGTPAKLSEVAGSQCSMVFTIGALSSEHRTLSRSALVFVNAGDILAVEITSNQGLLPLGPLTFDGLASAGAGTSPTDAAITIVRIQ